MIVSSPLPVKQTSIRTAAYGAFCAAASIRAFRTAVRMEIEIRRPDDWHLHLRDGAAMAAVLPFTAARFARAIVMPNLKPPVTTTAAALGISRSASWRHCPPVARFTPLMTLYLTDQHRPGGNRQARKRSVVHACKLYPAGATTNSDSGVTDIRRIDAVLARMSELGMPLLVHGEVTARQLTCSIAKRVSSTKCSRRRSRASRNCAWCSNTSPRARRGVREDGARRRRRDHHAPAPAAQPQRDLRRRHSPALLLPADPQDRAGSRGAARRRHQRQSALLPRHRQRAARAAHQGKRLRLRRHVLRARRHRAVCRSVRGRGQARQARRIRFRLRRGFLRPAAQYRAHPAREARVASAG